MMRLGDMNGTLYITTPINPITIITTSLTEENVQPLYDAADKYDVKDLQEECIFFHDFLYPCQQRHRYDGLCPFVFYRVPRG